MRQGRCYFVWVCQIKTAIYCFLICLSMCRCRYPGLGQALGHGEILFRTVPRVVFLGSRALIFRSATRALSRTYWYGRYEMPQAHHIFSASALALSGRCDLCVCEWGRRGRQRGDRCAAHAARVGCPGDPRNHPVATAQCLSGGFESGVGASGSSCAI